MVRGLFAVVAVRGTERGAGALMGAVRENEDLLGRAGLDDAMGPDRGQVVGPRRRCFIEWYGSSAWIRSVRIRSAGIRAAVDDDEVALAQSGQGLVQARRSGRELGERLVLPRVGQCEESLLESTEPSPRRVQFTPSNVDGPGGMPD